MRTRFSRSSETASCASAARSTDSTWSRRTSGASHPTRSTSTTRPTPRGRYCRGRAGTSSSGTVTRRRVARSSTCRRDSRLRSVRDPSPGPAPRPAPPFTPPGWTARSRAGIASWALRGFFEDLGPDRCSELETVTLDLSQAYIEAVRNSAPQAKRS
ncbi:MAG: hypothetical protein E2O39_11300 [Planctomycetota bacterium]|nr:MAG: hypothetical protein E2O39_11300 [Planctomycetota bacterium]